MMACSIHLCRRVLGWSMAISAVVLFALLPAWADSGHDDGYGFIGFADTHLLVSEADDLVALRVRRGEGATGAVAVHFRTEHEGSATSSTDYVPTSGVLEWGPGDRTDRFIVLRLIDDLRREGPETFHVLLLEPIGGATFAAGKRTAVVRILDNDSKNNDDDSDSEADSESDSDEDSDSEKGDDCCEGGVTELTLLYNGAEAADVEVSQKIKGTHTAIFSDTIEPGETFTVVGMSDKGTLGSEIELFVDGAPDARIHTSCSQAVGPGLVRGSFEVVEGMSRKGGMLCPVPDQEPPGDGCEECEGQVTELTLAYTGDLAMPLIQVFQKIKGKDVEIFNDTLEPDEPFTIEGANDKGTLGSKISLVVDGAPNARIHTSCSEPVGPGLTAGDFEVLAGTSRKGGRLCPVDDNNEPGPDCGECEGQVTRLTLRYLGDIQQAQVQVTQKLHGEEVLVFDEPVDPQQPFTIDGDSKHGTFGSKIRIYVNGELDAEFHTSCSEPIGPGLVNGSFLVEDGFSRKGERLCPIPEDGE